MLLILVAGSYVFGGDIYMAARDVAALRAERNVLAAEVERLQTELAVERATRIELARHAADLNAQLADLSGQIKFLSARKAAGNSAD